MRRKSIGYKKVFSKIIKINYSTCKKINYMKYKYLEYWERIDADARNIFNYMSSSKLKCIIDLNLCSKRIGIINKNKTLNYYSYYYNIEN